MFSCTNPQDAASGGADGEEGEKVAEVLDLQKQRRRLAAKRGFKSWKRRFPDSFDDATTLKDLEEKTLKALIQGGEGSSMPLYDLVLGVLNLGAGARFYSLEGPDKMMVMDVTLFLLDQLRFEAMRRLGWVEDYPARCMPMLDLIEQFVPLYSQTRHQSPPLSPSHPRYDEYRQTFEGDRSAFIRKLIPEAIQIFGAGNEDASEP